MKKIKLKFSGMGGRFDPENNFIVNILRKNFDVQLSDNPGLFDLFCEFKRLFELQLCKDLLYCRKFGPGF